MYTLQTFLIYCISLDKLDFKIARENAVKILGVEAVKLPASVRCIEEQVKKAESDPEKRARADPAPRNKPPQVRLIHANILMFEIWGQ